MTAEIKPKEPVPEKKPEETPEKSGEVYVAPKFPTHEISHDLKEIAVQRHVHRLWQQYLREQSTGSQETGNPAIDQTVSPTKAVDINAIINANRELSEQPEAAEFENSLKNAATETNQSNQ